MTNYAVTLFRYTFELTAPYVNGLVVTLCSMIIFQAYGNLTS